MHVPIQHALCSAARLPHTQLRGGHLTTPYILSTYTRLPHPCKAASPHLRDAVGLPHVAPDETFHILQFIQPPDWLAAICSINERRQGGVYC